MKTIIKTAVNACLLGTVITVLGFALNASLNKEADRMDAVRIDNCTKYGAAMNKHYGQEVCPPTPQG